MARLGFGLCLAVVTTFVGVGWGSFVSAEKTMAQEVSVNVFPGGFNWPLWVAMDRGLALRHGLKLRVSETRSSVDQMIGVNRGQYQIAMTGFDNVVAYHEGQGMGGKEPPAPIVAVMGGDSGFLSLVAGSEIETVGQLRGHKIGVDAPATGYAFALYDILARAGVKPGDYDLVEAGGVVQRYDRLLAKEFSATLLVSPLDGRAEKAGFRKLASVIDTFGSYQGYVAAVRKDWAVKNARALTGYVAAYRDALDWLFDPSNKSAALEIFKNHMPDANQAQAEAAYEVLLDPKNGFAKDAAIQSDGMRTVLALRERYAPGPKLAFGPPEKYYVGTYYDAASRQRRK